MLIWDESGNGEASELWDIITTEGHGYGHWRGTWSKDAAT